MATAIVPVRASPVLAATLKTTAPSLVPDPPPAMVIQARSTTVVQAAAACTANVSPVVSVSGTWMDVGFNEKYWIFSANVRAMISAPWSLG